MKRICFISLALLSTFSQAGTWQIVGAPDLTDVFVANGATIQSSSNNSVLWTLTGSIYAPYPGITTKMMTVQGEVRWKVRYTAADQSDPGPGQALVVKFLPYGHAQSAASIYNYASSAVALSTIATIGFARLAQFAYTGPPIPWAGSATDGSTTPANQPPFYGATDQTWYQVGKMTWESTIRMHVNEVAVLSTEGNGTKLASSNCSVRVTVVEVDGSPVTHV